MPDRSAREPESRLTHAHALSRSARVSDVRYDLRLALGDNETTFSGEVIIDFALSGADEPLTIDFADGFVDALAVNGIDVAATYNGSFLELPDDILREGENTVHVMFAHDYSRSGQGLHRFVDPEDDRVYLHTHFEPYDANRLFPCFDQPDLRARYRLQVRAPANWQVISATREAEITDEGEYRIWFFPETLPFSTYIFPLHAGDYRVWEDAAGDIPLRLFARQSLAPHVRPDDWFLLTRQGFEFFQDYFDLPYPYGKYDQLIVPEFNIGGMENVAAVTYTESFIRRGNYTREDMESLANTLLHELSHMWFGDLVTPAWWDGLWLKEAFATYMGYLAQAEATEYTDAWQYFFMNAKRRGYFADQLVTTHPVQVEVPDTHYAVNNFDDITYRKGASVLTQLSHFVGEEAFRDGTRIYLERHANGVTKLDDFIAALEEASGLALGDWVTGWLETAGLNTVTAEAKCGAGLLQELSLVQSAPADHPALRDHRIQVGLLTWNDDDSVQATVLPVTLSGETTQIPDAAGEPCPQLIYPNYGDWGFIKVALDTRTLTDIGRNLRRVEDPMLRSMLWDSLWEMVRDARLDLEGYAEIVFEALPGESNEKVASQVAENIGATMRYLWKLPGGMEPLLEDLGPRFEELAWNQAVDAPNGSDLQTLWLDTYRRLAHTDAALGRLERQLTGDAQLPIDALDQDRRWLVLGRLNSFDRPGALELAQAELEDDPSDAGAQMFISIQATRPGVENKRAWLARITDEESDLSLRRKRSVMGWLLSSYQWQEQAALTDEILASLVELGETQEDAFLNSYGTLIPRLHREDSVERLERFIAEHPDLRPILMKRLLIARQEDQRGLDITRRLGESR